MLCRAIAKREKRIRCFKGSFQFILINQEKYWQASGIRRLSLLPDILTYFPSTLIMIVQFASLFREKLANLRLDYASYLLAHSLFASKYIFSHRTRLTKLIPRLGGYTFWQDMLHRALFLSFHILYEKFTQFRKINLPISVHRRLSSIIFSRPWICIFISKFTKSFKKAHNKNTGI